MKEHKTLGRMIQKTDELKKLILENPDLPLVVLVEDEVIVGCEYRWVYAPDVSFKVGEILDCQQEINEEIVYHDRDVFRDDVEYWADCLFCDELSDEEFERKIKDTIAEYEPYWRKVIFIKAMT